MRISGKVLKNISLQNHVVFKILIVLEIFALDFKNLKILLLNSEKLAEGI